MYKDLGVFIGRFQPFHKGHFEVVLDAVERKRISNILIKMHESPPLL